MSFFHALLSQGQLLEYDLSGSTLYLSPADARAGLLAGHHNNLYQPKTWWHNGKSYFSFHGPYQSAGLGQGHLIVYDENNGVSGVYRVTETQAVADTHTVPSFIVDNSGVLYMFQERTHDTPIDINKGVHYAEFETLAEKIGTELSYVNVMKDDNGNGIVWCRMTKLYEAYSGGHIAVVKASSGMEGWGTPVQVTVNPNPDTNPGNETGNTRHYPCMPYCKQRAGGFYHLTVTERTDDAVTGLGKWNKYYYLKTPDSGADSFVRFYNADESFSKDVVVSGALTETELNTNFKFFETDDYTKSAQHPVATVDGSGNFYVVTGTSDGLGDLLLHYYVGGSWTTKTLNISDYVVNDPTNLQYHNVKHIRHYGGYLEVGIIIQGMSYYKPHLFRTEDLGDNWTDEGDMLAGVNENVSGITLPFNLNDIPANRNSIIVFSENDTVATENRRLWIKRFANGTIQTETHTTVTPIASYSDAYDLFDYKCDNGSITRSGNNVLSLVDQFGLRNATGVNNPQWDGLDSILLNGTNNYFSIPTSGLTALTKITLFAVARVNANSAIIVGFSDNVNDTFGMFLLADANVSSYPSYAYKDSPTFVARDYGATACNDNTWRLITMVLDGRCKFDIFVNGVKQRYEATGFVNAAGYAKRGKFNWGTPTSIRIGGRDASGTDTFTALNFKRIMMKSAVYSHDEQRQFEAAIAAEHGITLPHPFN